MTTEIEGREEYVRDNAVSLLADRDVKIERQRKRLAQVESQCAGLRNELEQARLREHFLREHIAQLEAANRHTITTAGGTDTEAASADASPRGDAPLEDAWYLLAKDAICALVPRDPETRALIRQLSDRFSALATEATPTPSEHADRLAASRERYEQLRHGIVPTPREEP